MKIALGKSKLSEVILISSVVFDEVPAHQKSTLRDTETSVSAQTFKIPGGPHGTEGVQPESALTGAWDEDPNHVKTRDAWLEHCLSVGTTAGTEQSRSVSGLD